MTADSSDPFGLVGRTLEQGVVVERVVGEGGFGIVYRAHHPGLDAKVAVKVLKLEARLSAEQRENLLKKFREETQVLYKLSLRTLSVARALGVGSVELANGGWAPYTMLEWLEGRSLHDDLIARRSKGLQGRSLDEVVAILDPIADALERAHEIGVVHRDVKPANIFLAEGEAGTTAKLLDFGIAKVLKDGLPSASTATNMRAFTPAYAAPEQYSAKFGATSPRTDVYALALVAVEMMTDKNPLGVDDAPMMMHATLDPSSRPTPKTIGADVSAGIESCFRAALAVDPFERPQSIAAWWSALKEAAKTGEYRPPSTPRAPAVAPDIASMDTASFADLMRGATEKQFTPRGTEKMVTHRGTEKMAVTRPEATQPATSAPHTTSSAALLSPEPPPARATSSRGAGLKIGAGVAVAALVAATVALKMRAPEPSSRAGTDSVSVAPPSTAAPASNSSPAPSASSELSGHASDGKPSVALAALTVPQGALPSGLWLPKFTFSREAMAGRAGYFGAIDQCNAEGMSLCSEPQWIRACEAFAAVGDVAAMTMSVDDERGVVVRGGASGCNAREVVSGSAATGYDKPIACCTRAIAIESSNTNQGFLATTHAKLLALEKATGAADPPAIAPLLATTVSFFAKPKPRDEAASELAKAARLPQTWSYDLRCRVTLETGNDPTWTADCQKVGRHQSDVSVFTTRYVWGGPDMAVTSVSGLAVTRQYSPL